MRSISLHLLGGTQYGKGQKRSRLSLHYLLMDTSYHTPPNRVSHACMWQFRNCIQYPARINWTKIVALKPCWRFTCRCWWTLSRQRLRLSPLQGHGGSWRSGHHTVCTPVRSISQKKCSQSLVVGEWHFALVTCATLINSDPRPLYHPHESLMRTIFTAWPWPQQTLLIFSFKKGIRVRERGETHTHTH